MTHELCDNGDLTLSGIYDQICAGVLLRLDDWKTCRAAGARPGQMHTLTAAGLVRSEPDFARYGLARAAHHPLVYRRTKAGERAAELIRAVMPETPIHRTDAGTPKERR